MCCGANFYISIWRAEVLKDWLAGGLWQSSNHNFYRRRDADVGFYEESSAYPHLGGVIGRNEISPLLRDNKIKLMHTRQLNTHTGEEKVAEEQIQR